MSERDWRDRAVECTKGNQTLIGAILLAVLGRSTGTPRLGRSARITSDNVVMASLMSRRTAWHASVPICMKNDLIGGFRRLADALKLSDAERLDMFKELRQWIARDDSAPYDTEERLGITPKNRSK